MVDLRRHYEWLVVPPEIEYEVCPEGRSWFDKVGVQFKQGRFLHPTQPEKSTRDPVRLLEIIGKRKDNG